MKYLAKRIGNNNYRGSKSSQHNRYTMDQIYMILKNLDKYAPNRSLFSMRTTDISKRPKPNPDEVSYTDFCEKCKLETGIGTPDAMRKNMFPDFARMRLIDRYDKNRVLIDPYKRKGVKFVSLTDIGLRFINAENMSDKYLIFSKCVNKLLGGKIDDLFSIFDMPDACIKKINVYEYTFFVSAIGYDDEDIGLSVHRAIELLESYQSLTVQQRNAIIDALRRDMDPDEDKPKTERRDFHNWINKTQQIFYLLNQTPYFEVIDGNLKSIDDVDSDSENKLIRSQSEKQNYFAKHNVDKKPGFELHHIVPLSNSESKSHFKLLDTWKNMIYIDGYTHAQITQKKTRNVRLKPDGDDLELWNISGDDKISLENEKHVKYDTRHKSTMIEYNRDMINI